MEQRLEWQNFQPAGVTADEAGSAKPEAGLGHGQDRQGYVEPPCISLQEDACAHGEPVALDRRH